MKGRIKEKKWDQLPLESQKNGEWTKQSKYQSNLLCSLIAEWQKLIVS